MISRLLPLLGASLLAAGLAANPAAAQTLSPSPQPPAGQHPLQPRLVERFTDANTTHDGKLTLAQAQAAHLGWIVRNFAAVDAGAKGYVTQADLQTYRNGHLREAAPAAAPNVVVPGPGAPAMAANRPFGGQGSGQAGRQRFIDKFTAANTAGDGRLTLDQARAGRMPFVAKNFAAIDASGKGYVTLQDVRAYRQQMVRARGTGGTVGVAAAAARRPWTARPVPPDSRAGGWSVG